MDAYRNLDVRPEYDDRRERQEITLKWVFAAVGLVVMVAELALATVVFWRYTSAHGWRVPDAVVATYLGATVVQAVALVTVMTRSLFAAPAAEPARRPP